MVKILLRYQGSQPKAFIGQLDLNNVSPNSVKYRNELVIFKNNNFIKKLIEVRFIKNFKLLNFKKNNFLFVSDAKY